MPKGGAREGAGRPRTRPEPAEKRPRGRPRTKPEGSRAVTVYLTPEALAVYDEWPDGEKSARVSALIAG